MPSHLKSFVTRALPLCLVLAVQAGPALAEQPDLDTGGFEAGEVEVETNGWASDDGWTVRPELEIGVASNLGLELQADLGREPGEDARLRELSAQASLDLAKDGRLGVAIEGGYDFEEDLTAVEAFVYASPAFGAWQADLNLGVEHAGEDTAAIYAWRLERDFGARWSAGFEGGGSWSLGGGEEPERRQAGVAAAYRLARSPLRVSAAALAAKHEGALFRLGFEWAL